MVSSFFFFWNLTKYNFDMIRYASNEEQLDFADVLIAQNISEINSRKDVCLTKRFSYEDYNGVKHEFDGIPICSANMGTTGVVSFAYEMVKSQYFTALEKHIEAKQILEFFDDLTERAKNDGKDEAAYRSLVFLTIGIRESLDTLKEVNAKYPLFGILFDVPNGTIPNAINRLAELRKEFPKAYIIAKTVCDAKQVQFLYDFGADCVGLAVGQGAQCLTRLKTGVGRPAFSALAEAVDVADKNDKQLLCDGGITCAGDICKAFAVGADWVMIGSLFAATEEASDGEIIMNNGKRYKQQYGMSSFYAQKKLFKSTKKEMAHRTSEGRTKLIPCSGPVADLIADFNGGLRSCGTYIGAKNLEEFPLKARFYKVRRQLNETFANCKDF